jgi:exopolyphosphatase / guanosine-5'-triphosphate,3'-diphosphate pyrophosphatase
MPRRLGSHPTLAAVDLGSNSFRMVLADVVDGALRRRDSLREGVRLAAALGADGRISSDGEARALACLARFGERVRDLPRSNVRVVGTNTLRKARGARSFLEKARTALGHPVEVISGQEEARLVYQGVAADLGPGDERRLVVDIGGGSTECILGRGTVAERAESLYVGCVGMTLEHFPGGRLRRDYLRHAVLAARLELEAFEGELRGAGRDGDRAWATCAGSSGTVRAIAAVVRRNGWSTDGITLPALRKLRKAMLAAGDVSSLKLSGLSRERAAVLPGGLAILWAVFRAFGVERMVASRASLREGVLQDLLGRLGKRDVRPRTVARLQEQYRVDRAQAERVEATALALYEQVEQAWGLGGREARDYLAWAARLHEIGLAVAHGGFHKHGAYLVANSELAGFSLQEQQLLAFLVRAQRRKWPRAAAEELVPERQAQAVPLAVLLRLATLLHRGRGTRSLPPIAVTASEKVLRVRFPRGWLRAHPLTRADLGQESAWLSAADWELRWE